MFCEKCKKMMAVIVILAVLFIALIFATVDSIVLVWEFQALYLYTINTYGLISSMNDDESMTLGFESITALSERREQYQTENETPDGGMSMRFTNEPDISTDSHETDIMQRQIDERYQRENDSHSSPEDIKITNQPDVSTDSHETDITQTKIDEGPSHSTPESNVSTQFINQPDVSTYRHETEHMQRQVDDSYTSADLDNEFSWSEERSNFIQDNCNLIKCDDFDYFVTKQVTIFEDEDNKLWKVEIGQKAPEGTPEKVIMIVDTTGTGKSTLINAIVNHTLGIKWEDTFHLILIEEQGENQAKSQTDWITSYTVHHHNDFNIPYTITIIDTPGFGDTKGIERDNEIKK